MAAAAGKYQNAVPMLKLAYFLFVAAVSAGLLQLIAGSSHTRAVVIGLFLMAALLTALGLQRGP